MSDAARFGKPVAVPTGRAARATRLGGMAMSVAGQMALGGAAALGKGQRPVARDLLLTPANITRITSELARMRGAAMKLGQLVSMDTGDVLPPELTAILARLRAEADFMPPKQLKAVLADQWPKGWLGSFAKFDVHPIAAASIGQVHRAELKDGRELAIKVQYPGVADSIESDVANVAFLIRLSGLLPGGFDIDFYAKEAAQQLRAETDYRQEGSHLAEFGRILSNDPRYVVPRWQEDWTTGTILAMEFVDSLPLEAAYDWDQDARNDLATSLISLVFRELFELRLMQTDPNLANYRVQENGRALVLLDFGATRALKNQTVTSYATLLRAGLDGRYDDVMRAMEKIGFFDTSTSDEHKDILGRMAREVFEWITRTDALDFADPTLNATLHNLGMELARTGFVPPPLPIDALFLQRKLGGVFLIASNLRARVPVQKMLHAALDGMAPA